MSQDSASPAVTRWDIVLMALGAGILAGFLVGNVPPSLPVLRESLGRRPRSRGRSHRRRAPVPRLMPIAPATVDAPLTIGRFREECLPPPARAESRVIP